MTSNATLDRASTRPRSAQLPARPAPRRWRRLLVALLVLLLLGTAGWLVAFSSVLATRQVTVNGVRTLSAAEVRAAAAVPVGLPLARQDVEAIARRVAQLRPVGSVRVVRHWPHDVVITVQERTPLLAVRQPAGYALIDVTGFAYLTVPTVPAGITLTEADLSNTVLLAQLGTVSASLPGDLRSKVAKIQGYSTDGIQLTLSDGDTVFWGSADQSPLKAQVLTALLKQSGRTYNVSAPLYPTVR